MFISEEQLKQRLNNPRNLANRFRNGRIIDDLGQLTTQNLPALREDSHETQEIETERQQDLHQEGIQLREIKRPGNNRPWLSKSDRTRIYAEATTASSNGNKVGQKEIAQKYGVAVSTVSDIVNGKRRALDTNRSVDQNTINAIQAKVDLELDQVREAAIDRLMSGLGQLTDDKISAHNAKDISSICANMAKVVQQTIPQDKAAQQINLIVYTPEMRNEGNFDIVEVSQ